MRRLVVILGVVAVAAVAVTLWATSGGSGTTHGIVFDANVGGTRQLFTIDADGSHLQQVTHLRIQGGVIPGAAAPDWAPNGKSIIFHSDYANTKQAPITLFTVSPDGTNLAPVPLEIGLFSGYPAYSPDGKQISFDWDAAREAVHQQGIDIANADGSDVRRLTSLDSPNTIDHASDWSPDGEWIVFTEKRGDQQASLVKLRLDGTGRKELTKWALNADNAAWSPDGALIAFNSHEAPPAGVSANICVVRPDGTGFRQLTHYTGGKLSAFMGDWSPDGKQIVFHLQGAAVNQLFVLDVASGKIRQLTHMSSRSNPAHASWR